MMPENVSAIAKRLHMAADDMQMRLDPMTGKGQIASVLLITEKRYILMPFIIGIYEFHLYSYFIAASTVLISTSPRQP